MTSGTAPDRWLVLEVSKPADDEGVGMVVDALMALPTKGVVELDDSLVVYLPSPETDDPRELVDFVSDRIKEAVSGLPVTVSHRWQSHEAWEETWRQGLEPRRVTDRLVIAPSWTDPSLRVGEMLVTIDPGMAFGTAEHPSTRGSLRLLDGSLEPGDRVLDLGAGSGILGIAAIRLGADDVLAVEMDGWACRVIRENAELNGVGPQISVRHDRADEELLDNVGPFDGVLANIDPSVLVPLLASFRGCLEARDGWLIVAGILESEAPGVLDAAERAGFGLLDEDREDGWWSALLGLSPAN